MASLTAIVDTVTDADAATRPTARSELATEGLPRPTCSPTIHCRVGPGQFPSYYREYADDIAINVKAEDRQAHNLYLATAAEAGVLGFICLAAILLITLWNLALARRRWIGRRTDLANMATAFSLSVVTYMTTGIFLHLSYARYFWLIMALPARPHSSPSGRTRRPRRRDPADPAA